MAAVSSGPIHPQPLASRLSILQQTVPQIDPLFRSLATLRAHPPPILHTQTHPWPRSDGGPLARHAVNSKASRPLTSSAPRVTAPTALRQRRDGAYRLLPCPALPAPLGCPESPRAVVLTPPSMQFTFTCSARFAYLARVSLFQALATSHMASSGLPVCQTATSLLCDAT